MLLFPQASLRDFDPVPGGRDAAERGEQIHN